MAQPETGSPGAPGAATGATAKQKRRRQLLILGGGAALLVLLLIMRSRSQAAAASTGPSQQDLQNAADQAAQNQALQDQAAMGGGVPSAFGGNGSGLGGLTAGDIAGAVTSGIEDAGGFPPPPSGTGDGTGAPSAPSFQVTINTAGKPHRNSGGKGKSTGKGKGTKKTKNPAGGRPNTAPTGGSNHHNQQRSRRNRRRGWGTQYGGLKR